MPAGPRCWQDSKCFQRTFPVEQLRARTLRGKSTPVGRLWRRGVRGSGKRVKILYAAGRLRSESAEAPRGAGRCQDVGRTTTPAESLAAEGFDVLAESRGYTASHQVLTRHGETDSGAGAIAARKLEDAGIITNMNMLPGDTKALSPSGLRLGVQELTRVGMGVNEMAEVASLYARVLLKQEAPEQVRHDVQHLKSDFQHVQYCFDSESIPAYEGM